MFLQRSVWWGGGSALGGASTHRPYHARTAAQAARGWVSRSSNDLAKKEKHTVQVEPTFGLDLKLARKRGSFKRIKPHTLALSAAALLAVFNLFCTSEPLFCVFACLKGRPPPPSLNLSQRVCVVLCVMMACGALARRQQKQSSARHARTPKGWRSPTAETPPLAKTLCARLARGVPGKQAACIARVSECRNCAVGSQPQTLP